MEQVISDSSEWVQVRQVIADRQKLDGEGEFGDFILALEPEVVIDLVCFTVESATALVEALRGQVAHLIHCGSIWRYGPSLEAANLRGRSRDGRPAV